MVRECDEAGEYLKYALRITEVIDNHFAYWKYYFIEQNLWDSKHI